MIFPFLLWTAATQLAPAPAPQPSQPRAAIIIPAGTPVRLVTNGAIDSRSIVQGQRFALTVAEDVRAGDNVVIPRGTPAVGEIESLSGKGMFGKGARFTLQPLFIQLGSRRVNLTGIHREQGSEAVAPAAITTFLIGGLGMIITGKSATLPAGSVLYGELRDDARLDGEVPKQGS